MNLVDRTYFDGSNRVSYHFCPHPSNDPGSFFSAFLFFSLLKLSHKTVIRSFRILLPVGQHMT